LYLNYTQNLNSQLKYKYPIVKSTKIKHLKLIKRERRDAQFISEAESSGEVEEMRGAANGWR
jgi:hypothetical protein